jgi:hypothetical protein
MKKGYSFKITNDTFEQIKAVEINECNEILNGCTYFSHNAFLADIATVFTKYEYMGIDFVPNIAICLTKQNLYKFNPKDKESTLDSIISFLKLLKIPKCGVKITIFEHEQSTISKHVEMNSTNFQHLWGFKKSWVGDGNYIAVSKIRNKDWLKTQDLSFVEELGLEIKEITYGQTIEEQHDILRHAKCLVSQRGNAVYFAAMMQTPIMLVVDELGLDLAFPVNNKIGGIAFQNTIIGIDPDVINYDKIHLKNSHFDRFLFTYPNCDNVKLLKNILEDDDMQKHFINQIKEYKEEYFDRFDVIKRKIERIVNAKNTVEQTKKTRI